MLSTSTVWRRKTRLLFLRLLFLGLLYRQRAFAEPRLTRQYWPHVSCNLFRDELGLHAALPTQTMGVVAEPEARHSCAWQAETQAEWKTVENGWANLLGRVRHQLPPSAEIADGRFPQHGGPHHAATLAIPQFSGKTTMLQKTRVPLNGA